MMNKSILGFLALCCAFSTTAADRLAIAGGSLTELVYAIGAGDRVVGVDETTSFPPETASLPHIGYWKQLSSEGILSLRPDRFITWQDAGPTLVLEQLRTHNVRVLTLPRVPATVEQMYTNIHTLAAALGEQKKGDELVNTLRQRLEKVALRNAQMKPVNALFILSAGGSAPQVAGKGSVADAIMTLAGAHNVAQHNQYKGYSAEALIAANPDAIVVTSQMTQGDISRLAAVPGMTHTAAWKNQRIIVVDQALILGMGPRVADAVETLHQQFWPHQMEGKK